MEALITKTGKVAIKDNLTDIEFNPYGFLSGFKYGHSGQEIQYLLCEPKDFILDGKSANYFPEDKYLDYLNIKISIDELLEHAFPFFIDAPYGTMIVIEKYVYPGSSQLFTWQKFQWDYRKNEKIIYEKNFENELFIPTRATNPEPIYQVTTPAPEVQSFFDNHISILESEKLKDKKQQAVLALNMIAATMQNIIYRVFPVFQGDETFAVYISEQKSRWYEDTHFLDPDLKDLMRFHKALVNIYSRASLYRSDLSSTPNTTKLIALALTFDAYTLSIIPPVDRTDMLEYMVKNNLSTVRSIPTFEELVIRIVESFNYNLKQERDSFLAYLVKFRDVGHEESEHTSLFEQLYDRMSTAWGVTKATIGLLNWTFNSTWQPTHTRGSFIRAVYTLWIKSEYNPYEYETGDFMYNMGFRKRIDGERAYESSSFDANQDPIYGPEPLPAIKHYYTRYTGFRRLGMNEDGFDPLSHNFVSFHGDAAPLFVAFGIGTFLKLKKMSIACSFKSNRIEIRKVLGVDEVFYGKYEILQPVQLLIPDPGTHELMSPLTEGTGVNSDGSNLNPLIPVFILKYMEDSIYNDNVWEAVVLAYKVYSTVNPVLGLSKFSHLVSLSGMGTIRTTLQIFSLTVQYISVGAGVADFLMEYVTGCDNPFCNRIKNFLFFMQLTGVVSEGGLGMTSRVDDDDVATVGQSLELVEFYGHTEFSFLRETFSAAKSIVNYAVENGWPPEFEDQINEGFEITTPKAKLEQMTIDDSDQRYVAQCHSRLQKAFSDYPSDFEKDRYNFSEKNELFEEAAFKKMRIEAAVGIVYQASRKAISRIDPGDLLERMDNYNEKRAPQNRYPFTFVDKDAFDEFIEESIVPLLEFFMLKRDDTWLGRLFVGGDCVSTPLTSTPGPQDITNIYLVVSSQSAYSTHVHFRKEMYRNWIGKEDGNGKPYTKRKIDALVKGLNDSYSTYGRVQSQWICALDENNNIVSLKDKIAELSVKADIILINNSKGTIEPALQIDLP